MWNDIEPILKQLHNAPISNEEKAFGVVLKNLTAGPLVRNWLTFLLREFIAEEERRSYHTKKSLIYRMPRGTSIMPSNGKYA